MALIAKRKVGRSWREAVAARAAERGLAEPCLAAFERRLARGSDEVEAAYRALQSFGLLWSVTLPGEAVAPGTRAQKEDVPVV